MRVHRIVPNVATNDVGSAAAFYRDALGLDLLMDMGWVATYGTNDSKAQISFVADDGAGLPTPDLSVEVDDLDEALARMKRGGFPIEYGPVVEPWGVRRFFVRDPCGKLVNILVHA